MRLLVDMPLSPGLAAWLREQGHDAVQASALGLERASDAEVLARAREEQRVVLTADLDYPRLLALGGESGPGVILLRGGNWSEEAARSRLTAAFKALRGDAFEGAIVVIERERIRRTALPLGLPEEQ